MRTQIPSFRLPNSVIDEEVGPVLDLGVERPVRPRRSTSLKALLDEDYDAVFVGTGAPRGKDLDIPGREEADANIHIGIDWLTIVAFEHIDEHRQARRRARRRQHGDGLLPHRAAARRRGRHGHRARPRAEMKASPWEKEDAEHEGIPILDNHAPKEFIVEDGKLTAVVFEKMRAEYDDNGRRKLLPTGEPPVVIECDDVLMAIGQDNAFPGSSATSASSSTSGTCRSSTRRRSSRHAPACSSAATRPSDRRTSSGPWPTATRRRSRSTFMPRRGRSTSARRRWHQSGQPEDGHPRVELRQRHFASIAGCRCRMRTTPARAEEPARSRSSSASTSSWRSRRRALPELRCADGVSRSTCASSATPASTSARSTASTSPTNGEEDGSAPARCRAPAPNLTQDLYVSDGLKTGRVMVKDEDVCLHCGLCAERCPTGAWDMQKFSIADAQAGRRSGSTSRMLPEPDINDFVSSSPTSTARARPAPTSCSPRRSSAWACRSARGTSFPSNIQGLPTWYEVRVTRERAISGGATAST